MSLLYYVRFFLFSLGCLIHCHVQFVACTFVTCFNKDQSINQSINQMIECCRYYELLTDVSAQVKSNYVTLVVTATSASTYLHWLTLVQHITLPSMSPLTTSS